MVKDLCAVCINVLNTWTNKVLNGDLSSVFRTAQQALNKGLFLTANVLHARRMYDNGVLV